MMRINNTKNRKLITMIKSALTISSFLMISSLSVLNTQTTQVRLAELDSRTRILSTEEMIFQPKEPPKIMKNDNDQRQDKMCLWNEKIDSTVKNR